MLDFKARGKRAEGGDLVYGFYCFIEWTDLQKHYIIPDYASTFYGIEVLPETINRFSMLLDREKGQIYSGDILGFWGDEHWVIMGIVRYCNKPDCIYSGSWYLTNKDGTASDWADTDEGKPGNWHNLTVLGSAADNPELLK